MNQQKNLLLSNQQQQTSIEPTSNIDVDVQEVEEVLSTTKK